MFELRLNQGAALLLKAVAPLIDLADFANVSPDKVFLLIAGNSMISEGDFVMLWIPELTFACVICNVHGSFVLNLGRLYSNLNRAGDDGEDLISFVTVNSEFFPFAFVVVDFENHVDLDIEASIGQDIIRPTKKC
ncbi:uncharacterized protein LOC133707281 [Rosa rugosa]|uniref:uncharacterized protein LOC133707281 n=1 Tax=Rosa rugosa TaxID=74645 RepID=UPI002B41047D|nr:uncharacterized protein LOC133707281 [Rosa rugosa]